MSWQQDGIGARKGGTFVLNVLTADFARRLPPAIPLLEWERRKILNKEKAVTRQRRKISKERKLPIYLPDIVDC